MKTTSKLITLLVLTILVALGFLGTGTTSLDTNASVLAAPPTAGPQPVDESMHHFMEYVFEPNYKRLKASLAKSAFRSASSDVSEIMATRDEMVFLLHICWVQTCNGRIFERGCKTIFFCTAGQIKRKGVSVAWHPSSADAMRQYISSAVATCSICVSMRRSRT